MERQGTGSICIMLAAGLFCAAAVAAAPGDAALAAFLERQAALQALGDRPASSKALTDTVFATGFEPRDPTCEQDSDGDGLPDCVETNTGVFVGIHDTGTDPFNADSDGDGISDGDEVLGTLDGLDLPALGVNPLRRDILIEYDWFDDALECAAHSHKPTPAVLQRVAAVFAAAPIVNPDGSTGINLIQDVGQGGVLDGGNAIVGRFPVLTGALDADFRAIKAENFAAERLGYFRYVLLPHRYGGGSASSGYAEIIGDDAIVSLYCLYTEDNVARTIVHEVGHLLGLHHGGFEACNGKPNYNSLMNYRYQFSGTDSSCTASGDRRDDGFSSGSRLLLDERAVDEFQGVCGNPPIDWNGNGTLEAGFSQNLRPGFEADCGISLRKLADFDDWANITLLGLRDAAGLLKSIKQETGCAGAPVPHAH
jgi:hypothetical protein